MALNQYGRADAVQLSDMLALITRLIFAAPGKLDVGAIARRVENALIDMVGQV